MLPCPLNTFGSSTAIEEKPTIEKNASRRGKGVLRKTDNEWSVKKGEEKRVRDPAGPRAQRKNGVSEKK